MTEGGGLGPDFQQFSQSRLHQVYQFFLGPAELGNRFLRPAILGVKKMEGNRIPVADPAHPARNELGDIHLAKGGEAPGIRAS